jgi:protein SCO1
MITTKNIAHSALLTLTFAVFSLISGCTEQKAAFKGIDITGAEYSRNFALTDHNGQLRTIADFKGKIPVIFFGFTQCPDVCPTAMAELVEVKKKLGKQGDLVQGLFVTIDPERDTAPVLKAYMGNFDPTFLALRGDADQTAAVAKEFKIFYKKVEGKTASSYTMDHSAGSYTFDAAGKVRIYNRYGTGAQAIADDIGQLLAAK